jgi:glycine cleavage system H lipoate-binding protein/ABC-type phosphate transport system substrate-binding protein
MYSLSYSNLEGTENKQSSRAVHLSVYCSQDLQGLTSTWADEFIKNNPGVQINIRMLDDTESALRTGNNLIFLSGRDIRVPDGNWKMAVGREVIVPVININNPFLDELSLKGVSPETFSKLFLSQGKMMWGDVVENGGNMPVNLFLSNDNVVTSGIKQFLGLDKIPSQGINILDESQVLASVRNNPGAIGFCKLSSLYEEVSHNMAVNLQLLPIDKNGNGQLDYMENIYGDMNAFARGVWIGKYPKALSNDIYAVSAEQPATEPEVAFLKYVLTDGQQLLALSGYSDLVFSEVQSKLNKFNEGIVTVPSSGDSFSFQKVALFIVVALIVLSIMTGAVIGFGRPSKVQVADMPSEFRSAFNENTVRAPKGLFYDKTHTWAFMEKEGMVKVGIDDFMQRVTGRVSRIEMKKTGERIKKGEVLFSIIQQGKQLNIYSPISGIVKAQNPLLITNASLINSAPFSDGWVYLVEPFDWLRDMRLMSMSDRYVRWLKDEFTRLKDFLANALNADQVHYARVVLQDGGALKDSVLSDFGPETWEDFQTEFLDKSK